MENTEIIESTETTGDTGTTKNHEKQDKVIEICTAIALGIVALLTAWATWIGSLHGGNQATNYAKSNNLTAEANADWNEASQNYIADLSTWSEISTIIIELNFAEANGDEDTYAKNEWILQQIINDRTSDEFRDAINWALDQEDEFASPFEKEGYYESYYETSIAKMTEAETILEQGQADNANGDRFGLVTVLYSVVMFLLGITGTFKSVKNKYIVLGVSAVCLVLAVVIMVTIPLPTGFSIASFFGA